MIDENMAPNKQIEDSKNYLLQKKNNETHFKLLNLLVNILQAPYDGTRLRIPPNKWKESKFNPTL